MNHYRTTSLITGHSSNSTTLEIIRSRSNNQATISRFCFIFCAIEVFIISSHSFSTSSSINFPKASFNLFFLLQFSFPSLLLSFLHYQTTLEDIRPFVFMNFDPFVLYLKLFSPPPKLCKSSGMNNDKLKTF